MVAITRTHCRAGAFTQIELQALGWVNVFWKPDGGVDDVVEVIGG